MTRERRPHLGDTTPGEQLHVLRDWRQDTAEFPAVAPGPTEELPPARGRWRWAVGGALVLLALGAVGVAVAAGRQTDGAPPAVSSTSASPQAQGNQPSSSSASTGAAQPARPHHGKRAQQPTRQPAQQPTDAPTGAPQPPGGGPAGGPAAPSGAPAQPSGGPAGGPPAPPGG